MSIDLNLSADQAQIVDAMHKALQDAFPPSRLRGAYASSPDRPRLPVLAELGVFGLGIPEAIGGAGCGVVEEALLAVELGRFLVTPSAVATQLAAHVALQADQPALAEDFVAGRRIACMAVPLRPFAWDALDGVPAHLLDPEGAEYALLWRADGLALLRTASLRPEPVEAMDRAAQVHRCTLAASAVHIRSKNGALALQARLLNAAMLLGMAEATLALAVDYAKIRTQFGQPIGAFQAIKHRCASMAIRVEALQAQLTLAALAVRDDWQDAAFQAEALHRLATRWTLANARDTIQVHGAIGFTAEHDAHLYLLRAHLQEHIGGPVAALGEIKETAPCA